MDKVERANKRQYDGHNKRRVISEALGIERTDFEDWLKAKYLTDEMGSPEIAEYIFERTGVRYSPRSIQRVVEKTGVVRTQKESFRLAVKKGRVHWKLRRVKKDRLEIPKKLRYEIMKRDGFRCQMCGCGPDVQVLEIDHIVARCKGGDNNPSNLRVLCHDCNAGKAHAEGEVGGGTLVSGC
jgi:5-methylcytosine-specific restriction endonuclease McrA